MLGAGSQAAYWSVRLEGWADGEGGPGV